jgi:hypothetical protein
MARANIVTLDRWFKKYIKLCNIVTKSNTEHYCKCVTCGAVVQWSKIHGGHYVNASRMATRYDERNVHPQCYQCNSQKEGNCGAYTLFLVDKYGEGVIRELQNKSRQPIKMCNATVAQLTDYYRGMVKDKAKALGIKL